MTSRMSNILTMVQIAVIVLLVFIGMQHPRSFTDAGYAMMQSATAIASQHVTAEGVDSPGNNVIWFMGPNGTIKNSVVSQFYPDLEHWDIIAACDLDGDHVTDYLWWNNQSGATVPWLMNTDGTLRLAVVSAVVEPEWKFKGCGDIDLDGKADILWRYTNH